MYLSQSFDIDIATVAVAKLVDICRDHFCVAGNRVEHMTGAVSKWRAQERTDFG